MGTMNHGGTNIERLDQECQCSCGCKYNLAEYAKGEKICGACEDNCQPKPDAIDDHEDWLDYRRREWLANFIFNRYDPLLSNLDRVHIYLHVLRTVRSSTEETNVEQLARRLMDSTTELNRVWRGEVIIHQPELGPCGEAR